MYLKDVLKKKKKKILQLTDDTSLIECAPGTVCSVFGLCVSDFSKLHVYLLFIRILCFSLSVLFGGTE